MCIVGGGGEQLSWTGAQPSQPDHADTSSDANHTQQPPQCANETSQELAPASISNAGTQYLHGDRL